MLNIVQLIGLAVISVDHSDRYNLRMPNIV